jgi:hypothetical protein
MPQIAPVRRRRRDAPPPEPILAFNTSEELKVHVEHQAQALLGVSYREAFKRLKRGDLGDTIVAIEIELLRMLWAASRSR